MSPILVRSNSVAALAGMLGVVALSVCLGVCLGPGRLEAHEGHSHAKQAKGRVYHDSNHNRRWDRGERVLSKVPVSNGREIVETNAEGQYALEVDDRDGALFVIKPPGYRPAVNANQVPQHFYLHKPEGSRESKFPGVAPTGPLPESVDFALYPQEEPSQFSAILFGDPQPRDQREIDYIAHDVVEDLIGTKAAFGVTLGDILFDDLSLFESMNRTVGKIGIPWYNVIGNHDINRDSPDDRQSDETFERFYGPSYYAYNYGAVHFVVLDDVVWVNQNGKKEHYHAGLGPRQLEFLRNDLARVPKEQLVVLMMHIPLVNSTPWDESERKQLYELIKDRPHCVSISAHAHHHEHVLLDEQQGWPGAKRHHHIINVTVSGAWWRGAPNEYGVPHAMMADGAPNGYSVMHFDGAGYKLSFQAAGRPADFQLHISAPEEVASANLSETFVFANVFNVLPGAEVQYRIGDGPWQPMQPTQEPDPIAQRARELDLTIEKRPWTDTVAAKPSSHLWKVALPAGLSPGTYVIGVRGRLADGEWGTDRRILRVK